MSFGGKYEEQIKKRNNLKEKGTGQIKGMES
jgi:hypothetical protein